MPVKKSLCLYGGKIKEIQTGDTLFGLTSVSYSQTSFTISTETAITFGKSLKMTSSNRSTISGTGRLRIKN